MKRFEVTVFVDSPNLREAKRALRSLIYDGMSPREYCDELIASLTEVKPPKPKRDAATPPSEGRITDDSPCAFSFRGHRGVVCGSPAGKHPFKGGDPEAGHAFVPSVPCGCDRSDNDCRCRGYGIVPKPLAGGPHG